MKLIALLGGAAVSAFAMMGSASAAEDIESPKFEVTLAGKTAELRLYAPMIAAEVRVSADDQDGGGRWASCRRPTTSSATTFPAKRSP